MVINNEEAVGSLNNIFTGYKIKATCTEFEKVNHFEIFHLLLRPGCKLKNLENISSEIQLNLGMHVKPTFIPIPELGIVKMISATKANKIELSSLIQSSQHVVFGIDSSGNVLDVDLFKLPHLLVAGTTGSGKSVFLHNIIANFILKDQSIDIKLIDPKQVEFECYRNKNFGKCNISVKSTYEDSLVVLEQLHSVMEYRYKFLSSNGYRSVEDYNNANKSKINKILLIIDELADLMIKDKKSSKLENLICSIAAKSRAAGISLILATQRPSIDVITGLIKANFPARVCFRVSSSVDSRVVLDHNGAENLLYGGDAIFSGIDKSSRFQSAFVDPEKLCGVNYANI